MKNAKTVAAVVVTYNRRELLLENIAALSAQTAAGCCDIVIIDNASSDGTGEALRPFAEEGKVMGFCLNELMDKETEDRYRIELLINTLRFDSKKEV